MSEESKENLMAQNVMAQLNANFEHAMGVLLETQRTLSMDMGIAPPALASALAASYVTYVSALVASAGLPKEDVLKSCKEAIDTMEEFVSISYDRMVKSISEESK